MGVSDMYDDLPERRNRLRAQVGRRDGGATLLQILDAEADFDCDKMIKDEASQEQCAAVGCDFRQGGYVLNDSCYDPETQRVNLVGRIVDRGVDEQDVDQSEKFDRAQIMAFRRARQLHRRLQAKMDSAQELRRAEKQLKQLLAQNPDLHAAFEKYQEIGPLNYLTLRRALQGDSEAENKISEQQLKKSSDGRELLALAIAEFNANRWQFASPTGAAEDDLNTACDNVADPSVARCEAVGCGFAEAKGWLFNERRCVDEELMLADLGLAETGLGETQLYRLIEVFYLIDMLRDAPENQRSAEMRRKIAAFRKENAELAVVLDLYRAMGPAAFRDEIDRLNSFTKLPVAEQSAGRLISNQLPSLSRQNLATAAKVLLAIGALTALHFSAVEQPEQPISTMQDFYNNYWYNPEVYDKPAQAQTMGQILSAILGL